MTEPLHFRLDDLTHPKTRALVARHLVGMQEGSPPSSVHAFDIEGLRAPGVTFWSGWLDDEAVCCGALKEREGASGEIKSMRVADAYVGRGFGRAMLEHLTAEARARGMTSLWLETGSSAVFMAALQLYERAGFVRCGPFDDYVDDPFSVFMMRAL
jgi:putative acetyltransferase